MIRLASRRFFCTTLPKATNIKQTEKLAATDLQASFSKSITSELSKANQQILINRAEIHRNLALNFSEWEDGRMPIIEVDYSNEKLSDYFGVHTVGALASLAILPYLPSAIFAAGALGYISYATYINIPTFIGRMAPRINSIALLENNQLEILVNEGNTQRTLTVAKEDFEYGNFQGTNPFLSKLIQSSGTWCRVEGKRYLIGKQRRVNQHYLNEIL